MAGEMSTGKAIAKPIAPDGPTRILENDALAGGVIAGASEMLSMEDVRRLLLEARPLVKEEAIVTCLRSLRKDLRDFVNANNREAESFGFGSRGGEPLDCSGIRKRVQNTVVRLEAMGEERTGLTPLAVAQRSVIPQVTAVLDDFLVDLTSATSQGSLNQSDIVPFLKACGNLARALGEVVQALSTIKMEMSGASRTP